MLYYYGINLGSFWAGIACGWLGMRIGWWAGFGAAGLGMLAGYLVFVLGRPRLEGHGEPADPERLKRRVLGPINAEWGVYLLALAGVAAVWGAVQRYDVVGYLLLAGAAAVLGYLGWFMATKCGKAERRRLGLALVLILASVAFWTLYEQAGSSLNQFAARNVDLRLWAGQALTPAQAQAFQGGFILILAPLFAGLWALLESRRRDPDPVAKFAVALLLVGASFFVLVVGARFAGAGAQTPLVVLALAYLVQTTGELCLSPVGLSQMTKLSPPAVVSTVLATWFLGTSAAQWLAVRIAQLTAAETVAGQALDPAATLAVYVHVFAMIGGWGLAAGVLLLAASPWLRRWSSPS
jgi:POT family proton-dependent oligopeptide transporter